MALRASPSKRSDLAFAPARPLRRLPDTAGVSSTSPVAICMTRTAFATTSARRFSPLGPLGNRTSKTFNFLKAQPLRCEPGYKCQGLTNLCFCCKEQPLSAFERIALRDPVVLCGNVIKIPRLVATRANLPSTPFTFQTEAVPNSRLA